MPPRLRPSQQQTFDGYKLKVADQKEPSDIVEHRPRRHRYGLGALRGRVKKGMIFCSLLVGVFFLYWHHQGSEAARLTLKTEEVFKATWYLIKKEMRTDGSPSYREYASRRHSPNSEGKHMPGLQVDLGTLELPFQRPVEDCRTFTSVQVEKVIADITKRMSDKDLARLFENCFPNTLDTTIRWHLPDKHNPQSFIITGDMYFPL